MKKEEARRELEICNNEITTYKTAIADRVNRIAELEEIINKKDDWRDKLKPNNLGKYWYIAQSYYEGLFVVTSFGNDDSKPEYVFRKAEHAELLKDKCKLMIEMHAFAHSRNDGWLPDWARNDGWLPDWEDVRKRKFGILYNAYGGFKVGGREWCNYFVFGVSVKSKEIALEMLVEFGERIEEIYNKQY